jgi:hypothetical protein
LGAALNDEMSANLDEIRRLKSEVSSLKSSLEDSGAKAAKEEETAATLLKELNALKCVQ